MNNQQTESISPATWIPRILIGLAIVLLVYFTWVTYSFKGTYDDTFLAEENLGLIRGPLANEKYYRMGELDYKGKDPFEDSLPAGTSGQVDSSTADASPPEVSLIDSATDPTTP